LWEHNVEAVVNALLTKDPNKLAVFIDGFDGHCLNAYNYFKEQMPDIEFYSEDSMIDTFMYDGIPLSSNTLVEYEGKQGYLCLLEGTITFTEKEHV
jgi:hypothetical protein